MLSYRHAFHAGNHADVLKHLVLVRLLRHFLQKDKAFWVIDSHAGAGRYDLDHGYATRLAEYAEGIGRLWAHQNLPPALADYVELVRRFNRGGALTAYPGSPAFAAELLRPGDQLRLFERHSTDSALLQANFGGDKRIHIRAGDGFAGLKSVLPPAPRRGLILIDPSYETRDDYTKVVVALKDSLARFATGTYLIWYPRLARPEARQLPERLRRLPLQSWLDASLDVRTPSADGVGMHGSGLFVINPPWTLPGDLETCLPVLVAALGQDSGASFQLDRHIP